MAPLDPIKRQEDTLYWSQLKWEFFKDAEENVSGFLRKKLGIKEITTKYKRKTKWWAEEKKDFIKNTLEWAKSSLKAQMWEAYKIPVEKLNILKKSVFDILLARISHISQKVKIEIDPETGEKNMVVLWDIPTKELIDILKVVKTELWEATNINQSQMWDDEKELFREIWSVKII